MDKKRTLKRAISLACAVLFLAFGVNLGAEKFCLGDMILNSLGIPVWSKGTQGIHYPAIIGLVGMTTAFYVFSTTTKDAKKTMVNLFLGAVMVLSLLSILV